MKSKADCVKSSRTLRILYYWGKFVGFFSLTLSQSNELKFSYSSQVYGCLLAAAYGCIIYRVLFDGIMKTTDDPPIAKIIDFVALIGVFLENSSTWLITAFHQNRVKSIIGCFASVDEISKRLGVTDNYDKHVAQLGIQLALVNIVYFTSILLNIAAMANLPKFELLMWSCYVVPRIASINIGTLYLWSLVIVKEQFRSLNEKVRSLMRYECVGASEEDEQVYRRFLADRITTISQLHRELRDLIQRIVDHFCLLTFFTVATHFSNITINVYALYAIARVLGPNGEMAYVDLIAFSYWILVPLAILVVIGKISASTTHEVT